MEIMNSCKAMRSSFGVSMKLCKDDVREKIQEPVVRGVHQQAILKSEQLKGCDLMHTGGKGLMWEQLCFWKKASPVWHLYMKLR